MAGSLIKHIAAYEKKTVDTVRLTYIYHIMGFDFRDRIEGIKVHFLDWQYIDYREKPQLLLHHLILVAVNIRKSYRSRLQIE